MDFDISEEQEKNCSRNQASWNQGESLEDLQLLGRHVWYLHPINLLKHTLLLTTSTHWA